jgi:putative spermidine/putrescine transport system ATP-binding protein
VSKTEQQARVRRALDMVELGHLAVRRPAQLSGGQQQRVALARALVFEPRVVLMDEPLGALDKRLRENMQYEIIRLHHELGLTIVYVTHDQGEALTMSDRVAVFSEGCIQQLATPTELYENARNAFVANFVGENNGLRGRVTELTDDWATLTLENGEIVRGRRSEGLHADSPATLALRPERTRLGVDDATASNALSAQVQTVIYCGDHYRVEVALVGGTSMVAKVPNLQQYELPSVGEAVKVSWRHDDCKVLHLPSPGARQ